MGHELDPVRRKHIEERSLLVIAIRVFRIRRQAISLLALCRVRLDASKKAAADYLRIRIQERKSAPVPVARQFVQSKIRKRSIGLHVARE